mmetsp:Transcript_5464/g.14768  ORF Transcript_5464/g.14768 Transcript_5464/m.14768 type:complete len:81 (+) Transcript_5464:912-1154(+)
MGWQDRDHHWSPEELSSDIEQATISLLTLSVPPLASAAAVPPPCVLLSKPKRSEQTSPRARQKSGKSPGLPASLGWLAFG